MLKSFARSSWLVALLVAAAADARAQPRNLDIYWVDVEGGAATLIVSPSGESLLIDSGWEVGDRDAKRIFSAAQRAGLARIDYFILSHFHADHAGFAAGTASSTASSTSPLSRANRRNDRTAHSLCSTVLAW